MCMKCEVATRAIDTDPEPVSLVGHNRTSDKALAAMYDHDEFNYKYMLAHSGVVVHLAKHRINTMTRSENLANSKHSVY